MGTAVGIVFNSFNLGGNRILVTPKVDNAIEALMATALVSSGYAAVIVAPGAALQPGHEGRMGLSLVQVRVVTLTTKRLPGEVGFVC